MVRVAITVEQNWNTVPGGTARSTNRLISALKTYTSVDVIGLAGMHRRAPVLALPEGLALRTVPIPGRVLTQQWNLFTRPSVDRWVADCDALHGPAYLLPPASTPSIVTIHDLAFRHHPEWFTPHGVRFFNRFLQRTQRGDVPVIVPSRTTAADCIDAGIDESRVHVVPWGVDGSRVTTDRISAIRERYGLPDVYVVFVGTLEPRKNVETLVTAMRELPELPLVVIGPDGWGDVSIGDAMALPNLTDDEVATVIAAARVLVYPSRFEGFGLPVLEAMAEGTPVVVTAGTAPAELAADSGLAVSTTDAAELVEAIEAIVASDSLRQQLGAAGRIRAASFTWKRSAEGTAAVYAQRAAE